MFSAIHRWPSSSLWSRPFSISAMVLRRRRAALRGAVSAALVRLSCTASLSARAGGPEERLSPSCRRCSPSGLIPRGVAATPAHGRKASARHPTVHEVGCALRRHPRARASRQPPPPRFCFSPDCRLTGRSGCRRRHSGGKGACRADRGLGAPRAQPPHSTTPPGFLERHNTCLPTLPLLPLRESVVGAKLEKRR